MSAKHAGTLIRRLRVEAGLTRAELGAVAKLTDVQVRNLETGRRRPTRAQLDRIVGVPGIAWAAVALLAQHEAILLDLAPEPPPDPPGDGSPPTAPR